MKYIYIYTVAVVVTCFRAPDSLLPWSLCSYRFSHVTRTRISACTHTNVQLTRTHARNFIVSICVCFFLLFFFIYCACALPNDRTISYMSLTTVNFLLTSKYLSIIDFACVYVSVCVCRFFFFIPFYCWLSALRYAHCFLPASVCICIMYTVSRICLEIIVFFGWSPFEFLCCFFLLLWL